MLPFLRTARSAEYDAAAYKGGADLKKLTGVLLSLMLAGMFFALPAAAAGTSTTIMIYACGSDLQEYALDNFYTMAGIDIPENVNIVVWAGGTEEWADADLAAGEITSFNIEYDTFQNLEIVGPANMGEGDTLYEFMSYAEGAYPADRYGLILWDHGSGAAGGICYDEVWQDDMLSMSEINNALYRLIFEDGAPTFDFIGCDACLMASYEMAAHLMGYADYFVASQELEPVYGWGYDVWLSRFCENPDMSTAELCRTIADGYYETCAALESDAYFSQSVIYLPAVEKLVKHMEQFSLYMSDALNGGELANMSRMRARMFEFGSFYEQSADMVDMAQLVSAYSAYAPITARNVLGALEAAVVYKRNGGGVADACGLSILMPRYTFDTFDAYIAGYDAPGYMDNYSGFLREYAEAISTGDYVFSTQTPVQLAADDMGSYAFLDSLLDLIFPDSEYEAAETAVGAAPEPEQPWSFDIQGPHAPTNDFDAEKVYAYSMELSQAEMSNLSYVEGMLLMDVGAGEGYVDMGYLRNAWVDWANNTVYSMFDGRWPMLGDQVVPIYEQASNQISRRALIPALVNGAECYVIVIFDAENPEGHVIGYSAGYDENGLPVRGSCKLETGDVIVPLYTLYYEDAHGEAHTDSFEGDPITVGSAEPEFEFVSLEDSDTSFLYCFCLNDIYGDYQLSDFVEFEF